ncbi:DedA family protein [Nonomuraea sp. MG754425]|uniref:DedA family protein n=1 Tax=Nonomuraea sp. MG754425 TaxID=2570319 RepID=UPI001F2C7721|nr:DedA family protein [Nonomuraea sp. MG754425]MCF6471669.1 DedA family protein [Nonomuraea sp. MG754425]
MEALAVDLMSPEALIQSFGLIGIYVVLFAETGLLIGFFLPGDSLLFVTGLAASGAMTSLAGTALPLGPLLIGAPLSAIAGAQLGHYLGATAGRHLFRRPDRHERLRRAETYFARYGPARAIILARFVGVVRTFINPAAGMLGVPTGRFLLYNVIGAIVWTDGLILAGYLIGDRIPGGVDGYILPIVLIIMLLSLLPLIGTLLKARASPTSLYEPTSPDHYRLTPSGADQISHLLGQIADRDPDHRLRTLAGQLRHHITRHTDIPARPQGEQ